MNTIPRTREKGTRDHDTHKRQGSDPLLQTARGKLQNQRSKLNDQINRELRLRTGAENLFKATTNRKLRETVALELSYVNSNLQLLKEELADLNSSVQIYQNDAAAHYVPMLPLGLKETKEVDFKAPLKSYIREHYHENTNLYDKELQELNDIRQACRTPMRNAAGLQLLYEYYNQLYFTEKRFFPPNKSIGIYFEWYDSLTGVPIAQRTVGFEKGSILFNIGALYTQIGARQDRSIPEGVDAAIESFQSAAGTFQYLVENFSHAPSMDMQPQTLNMLIQLMLSQAQECVLEKVLLTGKSATMAWHIAIAQEAAMVSEMYQQSSLLMNFDAVRDYVPPSWLSMVEVKRQYFASLAYYFSAIAMVDQSDSGDVEKLTTLFNGLYVRKNGVNQDKSQIITHNPPRHHEDRKNIARCHLRQCIIGLEEAIRVHSMSKQLRRIDTFHDILRMGHDRALAKFSELEEEDDFSELEAVPGIVSKTCRKADIVGPDFSIHRVDDLFHNLGPLAIFSSRHEWTAARVVELNRQEGQDFGFSVRGDSPVIIAMVDSGSLADMVGMKVGDFMVGVADVDVKWSKHDEVVTLIKQHGNTLSIRLVTPLNRNFLEPQTSSGSSSGSPVSPSAGQEMRGRKEEMGSKGKGGLSWTLRRKRSSSKDKRKEKVVTNGNSTSLDKK